MWDPFQMMVDDWRRDYGNEGKLQGKHDIGIEIAGRMKSRGMDVNEIAKYIDITVDEILRADIEMIPIMVKNFVDGIKRDGIIIGRSMETLNIADRMKAAGKDVNEIAEFTGLTIDEILQL